MEDMRNELRTALSELGPRGRGRAYPKGLLEKVLTYTVARRRQGAKLVEVAAELALSDQTLSRWLGEKRASTKFVPVVASPTAPPASIAPSKIVVHAPRGLRIEGLDVVAVAELVRRVGE